MKVFILLIFYIFASFFYVPAKADDIDNIVAIVNDKIILSSDVDEILLFLEKTGKNFRIPLKIDFLKEKVIQKLISDSLILQEGNRTNIIITKEQIDNVIRNIALKKKISVHQLKKNILSHNIYDNFYKSNYVNNIKKALIINTIQDYEVRKRIHISKEEVNFVFKKLIKHNKKFQKINLSYILLRSKKQDSNDTLRNRKKIAERITNKLQQGYSFEDLCTNLNQHQSIFVVKKNFWIHFSDAQDNFSETLNIFKKGQILGPFLKDTGFYILKVNDIHSKKEDFETEFYMQHCLIKPSIVLTDVAAKKKIFNIYDNIKKGVYSFDDAVKNLSYDSYSFNKKGDLGWISKELFSTNFNKEYINFKKNEISKPIKSSFGWHIFKIVDKREVSQFYQLTKKRAYNILLNRKMILEKNDWIKELKKNSYIKIMRP